MIYLVDTNIFLRVLTKDDKNAFDACISFLEAVKRGKIAAVTTNLNCAEVVWTLKSYYNFSKEETIRAVKSIHNLNGLKIINGYHLDTALQLLSRFNIKFIDAMLASIDEVLQKRWTVVSYDTDFKKIDLILKKPEEIINIK